MATVAALTRTGASARRSGPRARTQRRASTTASAASDETRIARCTQSIAEAAPASAHSSSALPGRALPNGNAKNVSHSASSGTTTTKIAVTSSLSRPETKRPNGNATSSRTNSTSHRSLSQMPAVNSGDESLSRSHAPPNHSTPMAAITAPTRFSGRRAAPTTPLSTNDQPTVMPSTVSNVPSWVVAVAPMPAATATTTSTYTTGDSPRGPRTQPRRLGVAGMVAVRPTLSEPAGRCTISARGVRVLRGAHLLGQLLRRDPGGVAHRARRPRDLRGDAPRHLLGVDHHEARVALFQGLAERLQVVLAQHVVRAAGPRSQQGADAAARDQPADQPDGGEDRRDGADGEAPARAHRPPLGDRLVVPAHDLHLAGLVPDHDGRVEAGGGADVRIRGHHRVIVGERVLDLVVGRAQDVQHLGHGRLLSSDTEGSFAPAGGGR